MYKRQAVVIVFEPAIMTVYIDRVIILEVISFAIILQPSALHPRTISIPAAIASSVSALVMAGS